MRFLPRVITALAMFMLLIGYQNFSAPNGSDWDSQTSLKIIQEMQDFQRKDPGLPSELAVPSGGSDFESVRNNWAERQSKILLNGFDKKVEDAVNDTLNSYVAALTRSDSPEPSEATSVISSEGKKQSRHSASIDPDAIASANTAKSSEAANPSSETPAQKPRNFIKFPRPNAIKYEVSSNASFNLVANPGDTRFNYSQAYDDHTKIGIEHATSNRTTQMFLKYDW